MFFYKYFFIQVLTYKIIKMFMPHQRVNNVTKFRELGNVIHKIIAQMVY